MLEMLNFRHIVKFTILPVLIGSQGCYGLSDWLKRPTRRYLTASRIAPTGSRSQACHSITYQQRWPVEFVSMKGRKRGGGVPAKAAATSQQLADSAAAATKPRLLLLGSSQPSGDHRQSWPGDAEIEGERMAPLVSSHATRKSEEGVRGIPPACTTRKLRTAASNRRDGTASANSGHKHSCQSTRDGCRPRKQLSEQRPL